MLPLLHFLAFAFVVVEAAELSNDRGCALQLSIKHYLVENKQQEINEAKTVLFKAFFRDIRRRE